MAQLVYQKNAHHAAIRGFGASRSCGKFVGVGVQAFANINGKASYAGATLFLQLGRLR